MPDPVFSGIGALWYGNHENYESGFPHETAESQHFRAVATRYDKTDLMFLSALTLTAIVDYIN